LFGNLVAILEPGHEVQKIWGVKDPPERPHDRD